MRSTFKFFRHDAGHSAFASLTIETSPATQFAVFWASSLGHIQKIYDGIVRAGVNDAMRWHIEKGGSVCQFTVLELVELLVDTKPDAVRCAATAAAWKALGNLESELGFEFDGEWRVTRAS